MPKRLSRSQIIQKLRHLRASSPVGCHDYAFEIQEYIERQNELIDYLYSELVLWVNRHNQKVSDGEFQVVISDKEGLLIGMEVRK